MLTTVALRHPQQPQAVQVLDGIDAYRAWAHRVQRQPAQAGVPVVYAAEPDDDGPPQRLTPPPPNPASHKSPGPAASHSSGGDAAEEAAVTPPIDVCDSALRRQGGAQAGGPGPSDEGRAAPMPQLLHHCVRPRPAAKSSLAHGAAVTRGGPAAGAGRGPATGAGAGAADKQPSAAAASSLPNSPAAAAVPARPPVAPRFAVKSSLQPVRFGARASLVPGMGSWEPKADDPPPALRGPDEPAAGPAAAPGEKQRFVGVFETRGGFGARLTIGGKPRVSDRTFKTEEEAAREWCERLCCVFSTQREEIAREKQSRCGCASALGRSLLASQPDPQGPDVCCCWEEYQKLSQPEPRGEAR